LRSRGKSKATDRNALAVVGAVLGYQVYQERRQSAGIQITVGKSAVSIEKD
jgi:hypothetical protein